MSIVAADTLSNGNTLFLSVIDYSYKIMEWSPELKRNIYVIQLPKNYNRTMAISLFNEYIEESTEVEHV